VRGARPIFPAGLTGEISIPRTEGVSVPSRPPDIECEVIGHFDQYRDSLLRYTLSFGLSVHDGEEIVQDVFLALFGHLRAGKSRRNLSGWIFCVAHNLALKRRHSNQRLETEGDREGKLVESQVDPSPSPEALVVFAQRQRRLLAAVRTLPEQHQSCLRLRAEGLRYREIARVLGISLGSVARSLTRSLARLMTLDKRWHHAE
jgi:RNA polymerase sigma-70 factor (ECF subfamily)